MEMITVWKALLGVNWLDLGNGWRNLFLLSCLLQASALGAAFAIHGWWNKHSRAACFFTGAAVTPLVQYLWTLLLAFVWPHAPKLLYIGALPALAAGYWLCIFLRHFRKAPTLFRQGVAFVRRLCHFDKPALVSLCFAAAMVILLLPVSVRLATTTSAANPGDSGEYLGLAVRFCNDRELGSLLEKEDTTGHFRGHGHFPSLELYMSYGLMHTGNAYGYPYDKPVFTGLGLLNFYMAAACLALLITLTRERKRWILLGILLLNLVPNLYFSANGAPRDIWRILALLLAALFFAGLQPLTPRGWRPYAAKCLGALCVCFTAMSAHVVCFVVLPFVVVAWVFSAWYRAACSQEKRVMRELAAATGIALSGALGTLGAFWGNLWCYAKWGEMSPWRLMTTYTSAPWYQAYMLGEYKLEETTTQLNFWKDRYDIVMAYATPIGLWGMRLAVASLLLCIFCLLWRRVKSKNLAGGNPMAAEAQPLMYTALLTLCSLAPMSGLLDTKLYSFSGSFIALQRYTLQWFVLAAAMICAALAALEGLWPRVLVWCKAQWKRRPRNTYALRFAQHTRPLWQRLPAFLCAALCALAFVQGTRQTGYANSFYRYSRGVMEAEAANLDEPFLQRYGLLLAAARHVPQEQKILLTRAGYQYPLEARGYILTANPIVPIMNLPLAEIPAALAEMNVAMLATEPDFWDERYFALSTLSQYLNALPATQIFQDGSHMRLYILNLDVARALADDLY